MRAIRMLRAMWRELETGSRWTLPGHEGGNPGYRQGLTYGLSRQLSTLPFGRLYSPRTGQPRMGHRPSRRSIQRVVREIHTLTDHVTTWRETEEVVWRLNCLLRGWSNYFSVGTVSGAYRAVDSYTASRLSRWLRKKHRERRRGWGSYPPSHLYQALGLIRLTGLKHGVSWA